MLASQPAIPCGRRRTTKCGPEIRGSGRHPQPPRSSSAPARTFADDAVRRCTLQDDHRLHRSSAGRIREPRATFRISANHHLAGHHTAHRSSQTAAARSVIDHADVQVKVTSSVLPHAHSTRVQAVTPETRRCRRAPTIGESLPRGRPLAETTASSHRQIPNTSWPGRSPRSVLAERSRTGRLRGPDHDWVVEPFGVIAMHLVVLGPNQPFTRSPRRAPRCSTTSSPALTPTHGTGSPSRCFTHDCQLDSSTTKSCVEGAPDQRLEDAAKPRGTVPRAGHVEPVYGCQPAWS